MQVENKLPDETVNYRKHSPILEFSLLLGAFFGIVLLFYILSSIAVSWCVTFVPQELEAVIFSRSHLSTRETKSASNTTIGRQEEFLQTILDKLVAASPEIVLPLRARVRQTSVINAFALPGGDIIVTSEMVAKAKSENEIAMVLAHEMGHFKLRHQLRGIGLRVLVIWFQSVVGIEPEVLTVSSPVENFMALSFSRQDEQAADEFGLQAVYRAYDHVGGVTDFFDARALTESQVPGFQYLSTHPKSAERAAYLTSLLEKLGYPQHATKPKPSFLP